MDIEYRVHRRLVNIKEVKIIANLFNGHLLMFSGIEIESKFEERGSERERNFRIKRIFKNNQIV